MLNLPKQKSNTVALPLNRSMAALDSSEDQIKSEGKPKYNVNEMSSSYSFIYDENSSLLPAHVDRSLPSSKVLRPCYYILPILGLWQPVDVKLKFIWRIYRLFIFLVWFATLVAIMCLDFVHYGFHSKKVHTREIMNSACTCMDFLCPFLFTLYYFKRGQFVQLVSDVQNVSNKWYCKLSRITKWYTLMSLLLWGLCATFFMVHWFPFFSKPWHFAVYTPLIIFMSGWWGVWLAIYGFVCHVHSLQIDIVVEEMSSRQQKATDVFRRHFHLQKSVDRTQKDFNLIISLAIVYHTLDVIVFSFAYFNSAFGNDYPIWQYIGTVLFDIISLIFKLYPPVLIAAGAHRIVVQARKRCQFSVTVQSTELPLENMQLFQYIVLCEPDMGLKILGIRITVELAMKVLMTIGTIAVSFVAFVIPKLK